VWRVFGQLSCSANLPLGGLSPLPWPASWPPSHPRMAVLGNVLPHCQNSRPQSVTDLVHSLVIFLLLSSRSLTLTHVRHSFIRAEEHFVGTISTATESAGGYKQIPIRVQEYDQGKREFNAIAYYPADSARFAEIGRTLQLGSNLYISGELLIREKQRS
jgi:hypothetical protein